MDNLIDNIVQFSIANSKIIFLKGILSTRSTLYLF